MASSQDQVLNITVDLLAALLSDDVPAVASTLKCWKPDPEQRLPMYEAAVLVGSLEAVAALAAARVPLGPAADATGGSSGAELRLPRTITSLFRKRSEFSHLKSLMEELAHLAIGKGRHAAKLAVAAGRTDLLAALQQAGANLAQDSLPMLVLDAVRSRRGRDLIAGLATVQPTLDFLLSHGASPASCVRPVLQLVQASGCSYSLAEARKLVSWLTHVLDAAQDLSDLNDESVSLATRLAAAAGEMAQMERFAAEFEGCEGRLAGIAWDVILNALQSKETYALSKLLEYTGGLGLAADGGSGGGSNGGDSDSGGSSDTRPAAARSVAQFQRLLCEAAHDALELPSLPSNEALQLLVAAGMKVGMNHIFSAIWSQGPDGLSALRVLLAADNLPQPRTHGLVVDSVKHLEFLYEHCPMWRVLSWGHASHPMATGLLKKVEELAAAGYRPSVFTQVTDRKGRQTDYNPAASGSKEFDIIQFEISGRHRYLWLAANQVPWSPQQHHRFPEQVQAAVRTLLLAAHRGSRLVADPPPSREVTRRQRRTSALRQQQAALALMGCLPQEVLLNIARLAAFPLSAWAR